MRLSISLAAALVLGSIAGAQAQDNAMSFFVTSQNPGKGGDLGGLAAPRVDDHHLAAALEDPLDAARPVGRGGQ